MIGTGILKELANLLSRISGRVRLQVAPQAALNPLGNVFFLSERDVVQRQRANDINQATVPESDRCVGNQ